MTSLRALLVVAVLGGSALAQCSTLSITGTVNAGQTVAISVSGATANAPCFVMLGHAGNTTLNLGPLGMLVLNVTQPIALPLGMTNATGSASQSIAVPANIPANMLPNMTLTGQAVTVGGFSLPTGPGLPSGFPMLTFCVSNTATLVVGTG